MSEKLFVIKIGGNIIDDEQKLFSFLEGFSSIKEKKILIHGGGKLATQLAEKLNIPQQLIDGRRITDAETLKIITMVYAGYINKNIVAQLQSENCDAIGLCGADGNLMQAHKRQHPTIDYGFVGDIDNIHHDFLEQLLSLKLVPVISPVSHDTKGQLLNTNADTIAQETAKSLSNKYDVTLIYCFEKNAVLLNSDDEGSVVSEINFSSYKDLKEKKIIHSGMIPKLDNAFAAINSGVKKVIIGNAKNIHDLVTGSSGTTVL